MKIGKKSILLMPVCCLFSKQPSLLRTCCLSWAYAWQIAFLLRMLLSVISLACYFKNIFWRNKLAFSLTVTRARETCAGSFQNDQTSVQLWLIGRTPRRVLYFWSVNGNDKNNNWLTRCRNLNTSKFSILSFKIELQHFRFKD